MRPFYNLILITLVLSISIGLILNYGNQMQLVYIAALVIALFITKDFSIKATSLLLLVVSISEYYIFTLLITDGLSSSPIIYRSFGLLLLYLALDSLTFYLIKNRSSVLLKCFKNHPKTIPKKLSPCITDAPLIGIFFLFCVTDIMLLLEHFIRNLEHFGVPESFAKQFWHWDWVYYASQPTKLGLQALTIMVLFAGIYITRSRAARGEKPLSYDDCTASKP